MKNIIFLTDFSKHADAALDYLAAFSKTLPESNIYLIHTYALATKTGMLLSIKERMREYAKALLLARKSRFEKASGNRHFVFFKAVEGNLTAKVSKLKKQLDADLVVTSMRGESASSKNLIGPNAGGLIKGTTVPLLLIPPKHKFKDLEKITFALKKAKIKSAKTVSILSDLFNANNPKLRLLLADNPNGSFKISDLHLDKAKYTVGGSNEKSIYDSIMADQKKNPSDLIAVVRRKRGFFEKLLKDGAFKKKELDIKVPLLVLRGAE